ncbi:MAG: hypothetical protein ACHP84_05785 [Caulobacterales bacterium]
MAGTVAASVLGFAAGWRVHEWRDAAAEVGQAARVVRVVQRQDAVSQAVAVSHQAADDRIRVVTRMLIQEVPEHVTPKIDASFPLSAGFVRVHDAAAAGHELPAAAQGPGQPDEGPSPVAASAAATVIAGNYGACRADQQRLADLQAWVRAEGLTG